MALTIWSGFSSPLLSRGLLRNKRECKFSSFSLVHVVVTQSAGSGCSAGWIDERDGAFFDQSVLLLTSLQCQRRRRWHWCSCRRDRRSRSLQRGKREEEEKRSQEGWLWVCQCSSSSSFSFLISYISSPSVAKCPLLIWMANLVKGIFFVMNHIFSFDFLLGGVKTHMLIGFVLWHCLLAVRMTS